jgi:hypothetical protein
MSDNENQSPAPSKQTSSVPLRKETVRVTLKAADAPPAVPSATVQIAPSPRPTVPMGPPTPTVGGAPRPPAPAPTIPLRTAGPKPMAPAPTIRLAPTASPASPTRAIPPSAGSPPTIALPKATVQLQPPTVPLGTSIPSASALTNTVAEDEEEESDASAIVTVLSGLGLVAAVVVLAFQLMTANTWISAPENEGKGWSMLLD